MSYRLLASSGFTRPQGRSMKYRIVVDVEMKSRLSAEDLGLDIEEMVRNRGLRPEVLFGRKKDMEFMNKQIRIYVNGRFQFSISVAQDTAQTSLATRVREILKLSDSLVPRHAPGLINFVVQ